MEEDNDAHVVAVAGTETGKCRMTKRNDLVVGLGRRHMTENRVTLWERYHDYKEWGTIIQQK